MQPEPPSGAVLHQRSRGRLDGSFVPAPSGARLGRLYQAAPLRLLMPEPDAGDPTLAAVVNVAGGLAGGDRLETALSLGAGARVTVTSAAAEKVYRSLGAETELAVALDLAADAVVEWLPQETILFDGARLRRRLELSLATGARLLAAEMLVLGRAASGERFRRGALLDRWRLRQDGRLVWADALRIGDAEAVRSRFALGEAGALATLLLAAPDAARHREQARALAEGGATLLAPGVLLARWVGEAGAVRRGLGGAVAALRAAALDHPPHLPRLWRS